MVFHRVYDPEQSESEDTVIHAFHFKHALERLKRNKQRRKENMMARSRENKMIEQWIQLMDNGEITQLMQLKQEEIAELKKSRGPEEIAKLMASREEKIKELMELRNQEKKEPENSLLPAVNIDPTDPPVPNSKVISQEERLAQWK